MAISNRCIAYGGASTTCPPGHSMDAYRKAIELGVNMLYVEIRLTRDQEFVTWPSQQRILLDNPVHLDTHSLEEWRRLTTYDIAPVVSLADTINLAKSTGIGLTIDLKAPGGEMRLARQLRSSNVSFENLLVVSPTPGGRTVLRSLDPRIRVAHRLPMDHQGKITADFIKDLDVEAVFWPSLIITRDITRALKAKGIAVYAGPMTLWKEMHKQLQDHGVDGILTTYPEQLLENEKLLSAVKQAA